MTNKNLLSDEAFSDVRFPEKDEMITGRYVPYDFAIMYPSGTLP